MPASYRNIVDSHFHTQSMLEKGMDVYSLYDMLFSEGFGGGIDIGTVHDDLPERRKLLEPYPGILLSAAMGPWEAGASETRQDTADPGFIFNEPKSMACIAEELEILRGNMDRYSPRFIGEIGLDYYWEYGTHEKQEFIFRTQMRWAEERGLCVLIHNREADEDTERMIREEGPSKGGVIHCFSGEGKLMKTALDHGYYISFAGNLTYRRNQNLRDMLKAVPSDRLLLETDSPYLTPVPHRGKPNNPGFVRNVYECASQVLGLDITTLAEQVKTNFDSLCSR